jgi:hypothetical protein
MTSPHTQARLLASHFRSRGSFCVRSKKRASATITVTFANSVGWMNNTPTWNQRCAPNAACPSPESDIRNTIVTR